MATHIKLALKRLQEIIPEGKIAQQLKNSSLKIVFC